MVMTERFGSPMTRLMSVMKSFQVPVRSMQPGDKILVITDDAMDPLVWQAAMAAINEKGGEAVLCMWPRLAHHFADPPQMAIEAARGADAIFALNINDTTVFNGQRHGMSPPTRWKLSRYLPDHGPVSCAGNGLDVSLTPRPGPAG